MPNSLILTTPNYTQAEKNFFIADAMFGLDSINSGLFYFASDVKNDKYTFPKVVSTVVLQPAASIPTSSGTTTLSNKDVNLGKFMSYQEFEPSIFENHWQVDQISSKLLDRGLPATFENYLATTYTEQTLQPVEQMIWIGSTTYTGASNSNFVFFDGIIKQLLTPATAGLAITGQSTVSSANILAKLEALKNRLPKALLSDSARYKKLRYVMGVEDGQKYEEALTNSTFKNNDTTERGINRYKGYDIVVVAGMPEHTIIFGHFDSTLYSNLHIALTAEENMEFTIDRLQNNSTLYFYKMINKMGVGFQKGYELSYNTTYQLADFNL